MAKKHALSPEQDLAANPMENIWVQANAGTGKTSVLVQRLLRILFRSEQNDRPTGILCLTYTNAGASEMRNRILAALRQWAGASDADLGDMLTGISTNKTPTHDDLGYARGIFYKYIDNPDILKIKTIHGFCEEILRRFPMEAGISPAWNLISDSNQKILLADAFHRLINTPVADNDVVSTAFSHIVGRISEHSFEELLGTLTTQYRQFFAVDDISSFRKYFIDTIRKFLDLDTEVQTDILPQNLQNIIQMAELDINSSKKPAGYLVNLVNLTKQYIDKTIDFNEYKKAYLTATDTKISNVAKKEYLVAEQTRVYQINQRQLDEQIFEDTVALFDLSAAFTKKYRDLKSERNVLDFDDLILYTKRLFSKPESMGWVLSQLDISLSHILVDEAQDTSPEQWEILRMLSGDFFVGGNTAQDTRSLFVVGDTKQSIYAFQGADPAAFATSRDDIAAQIQNNMRTIQEVPLTQSFRSTEPILRTVDYFFGHSDIHDLAGFINNDHKCFRLGNPGLVEIHKVVSKEVDDNQTASIMRREYISNIATKIEHLVKNEGFAPKDIMVLVQRRNPFAGALVNELKSRNIDVVGSDRIVLPDFPAVRDLLNLVRFCINPADDYNLCCTLKSPLYRLKEHDILEVCQFKELHKNTVFDALKNIHPDIYQELSQIIEWSKTMAPYSFFTGVLNTFGGREKMIAALGTQIIDPLEEFMTICLAYERTQPGTLRHFLKWFVTGASEIKRDMDASNGVRIVTVHGSKGLEAPVVFLIDTIRTPRDKPTRIIDIDESAWLWVPQKSNSEALNAAADKVLNKKIAEYYRLLYVAMTRARDQLYIYGFTTNKSAPDIAWHTKLSEIAPNIPGATTDNDITRITNG